MNVTLVGPTHPYRGGISQHTTLLCHYLRRNHSVDFISFRKQYPKWLFPGKTDRDPSHVTDRETCVYLLDAANPLTWPNVSRRIKETSPEVVVMIWWIPFFALAWWYLVRGVKRWGNARIVFVCHNVLPHDSNRLLRWVTQAVLSLPDGFVVHSESDRNRLLGFYPTAQVIRCPMAPHPRLAVSPKGKTASRKVLGIAEDSSVYLFFGFVRPYKGLDVLLQAMVRVVGARPDALLCIVGEFWEPVEKYRNLIQKLEIEKHVQLVDRYVPNEEVADYFAACDVVVLPYRSATQSGVPQLAKSMGRPVIVTDVGGLAENVTAGQGRIVPAGDIEALAGAMMGYSHRSKENPMQTGSQGQAAIPEEWKSIVSAIETLSA